MAILENKMAILDSKLAILDPKIVISDPKTSRYTRLFFDEESEFLGPVFQKTD